MRRRFGAMAFSGLLLFGADNGAFAGETISYTYDELGRLVEVRSSGLVNNGLVRSACFDRAGNRQKYKVDAGGAVASCPVQAPSPPVVLPDDPPPPPANQSPVTTADSGSVGVCMSVTVNVVGNDSDPEGHLPLSLVSVGTSTKGEASISQGTSIHFSANGESGNTSVSYVVRDSLGATANGMLYISITSGQGCL